MLNLGGWEIGLDSLGATGIVALIIMMILTDRLVTRGRLQEARQETAYWRTAFENESAKNTHLAEGARDWGIVAKAVLKQERINTGQHEIIRREAQE
jgi:hypothetical protein